MNGMSMPHESWLVMATGYLGMWTAMMVPMMLPSLLPMLGRYGRSVSGSRGMRHRLTMLVALGYFVVWALLGVVAFVVSQGLGAADMRWGPGPGRLSFVTALVLLVAGSAQLSSWKARQLLRCRDESGCGGRRRSDALGAWRHGLTFGMRCALCCSGLMLALLAVGLMHMVAMALATLAITAERLAPAPERVARVAGVAMVTAGALALARI